MEQGSHGSAILGAIGGILIALLAIAIGASFSLIFEAPHHEGPGHEAGMHNAGEHQP